MTSLALADLSANDNPSWTDAEDRTLLNRGRWLGYGWVAMGMGRTEEQGRARIKYLRRKCPDLCAQYPKPRTGEL